MARSDESVEIRLSRNTRTAIEQLDEEPNEAEHTSCLDRWWHVVPNHQRAIVHIVETTIFHVAIVILVLVDCILVIGELMLDFILLNQKCGNKTKAVTEAHDDGKHNKLELAIEILHFASIVLLGIFVLEIMIKIYAFGKKWWNFREKKMEWVDAIIVIVSFVIDVTLLRTQSVIAEISLLFISFRLWRIVSIFNSD